MKRFLAVLSAIAIGGAVTAPSQVLAQGFVDLYIGGAFTKDSSLDWETSVLGNFSTDVRWDNSFAGGIRSGYWFRGRAKWIGLAADLSYFQADVSHGSMSGSPFVPLPSGTAKFHVIPISLLAMVRLPLFTSDGFESGRLQPYGAIGPGFFLSVFTAEGVPGSEAGFDVGLDARVGVTALLTPRFGVFIEYRRTDVDVDITDAVGDKLKTSLQTNHVNGGVTLRF